MLMAEFDIAAPARTCAASGRELRPGDRVVSVLREDDGRFARSDFAEDAWQGPPPEAIAWWHGRIPDSKKPAKPTFNEEVLLDLFRHLSEAADPQRVNFRYVTALLLMRRKRLKFDDLHKSDGRDMLLVRDARTGQRFEVLDPRLDEDAIAGVQDELFAALGWS